MQAPTYIHAATSLKLASWRHFPAFTLATRRVIRALGDVPGHLAHDLRANLLTRTFRTYSIYEDRHALARFMASEAHRAAAEKFADWALPGSKIITWEDAGRSIDWAEAGRRLAQAPNYPFARRP